MKPKDLPFISNWLNKSTSAEQMCNFIEKYFTHILKILGIHDNYQLYRPVHAYLYISSNLILYVCYESDAPIIHSDWVSISFNRLPYSGGAPMISILIHRRSTDDHDFLWWLWKWGWDCVVDSFFINYKQTLNKSPSPPTKIHCFWAKILIFIGCVFRPCSSFFQ